MDIQKVTVYPYFVNEPDDDWQDNCFCDLCHILEPARVVFEDGRFCLRHAAGRAIRVEEATA